MSSRLVTTKEKLLDHLSDFDNMTQILFSRPDEPLPFPMSVREEFNRKQNKIFEAAYEIGRHSVVQNKINELVELNRQLDEHISSYQEQLMRLDHLLRTAIYYSKQKLRSVKIAQRSPLNPDHLFKFSHQISASHGAVAPEGWVQGDPRRPYPLDGDMRTGYLGHIDDVTEEFLPTIYELLKNSLQGADAASPGTAEAASAGPDGAVLGKEKPPSWLSSPSASPPLLSGDRAAKTEVERDEEEEDEEDEEEEEEEEDEDEDEESLSSHTSDLLVPTSTSTSAVVTPVKSNRLSSVHLDFDGPGSREDGDDDEVEVTEMMSTDDDSSSLSDAS